MHRQQNIITYNKNTPFYPPSPALVNGNTVLAAQQLKWSAIIKQYWNVFT